MSAIWSCDEICLISSSFITFSRTKYRSSSMCFVRACRIGFADISTILKLSHHSTGTRPWEICNYVSKDCIQVTSASKIARLLYSTLVLLLENMFCFFEFQGIIFEPRYTQKPVVDLLSSRSKAQSTSQNPIICSLIS